MKQYPSIFTVEQAGIPKNPQCIAFFKHDGSNLRFEYTKGEWNKFGTRTKLFDESHSVFGEAIPLFFQQWAEVLSSILDKNKIQKATAFFEFYGPSSFAGIHEPNEKRNLTLIDVDVYKQGIMSARDFVKLFGHLEIPKIIYEGNLTNQFVEDVYNGKYDVVEGIVAKGGNKKHKIWMRKAKTKTYLDKLKSKGLEE